MKSAPTENSDHDAERKGNRGDQTPILNIVRWRSGDLGVGGAFGLSDCGLGAIGGAGSARGASAAITLSDGKVTITSVPIRSLDLSVKVPL
jgi:hypothetical protein